MITCREGHLRIRWQRKSWRKTETEHFAHIPAKFSHGVWKVPFVLGKPLPLRIACENFTPFAKSSSSFLKTIALGPQIRTLCEFPQGLRKFHFAKFHSKNFFFTAYIPTSFLTSLVIFTPFCETFAWLWKFCLKRYHFLPLFSLAIETLRTMFILVEGRVEEISIVNIARIFC